MIITDAQIHVWAGDRPERPWPSYGWDFNHGTDDYTQEHVLAEMDAAGVHRAIIVPPSWEGDRNDLALKAAADFPDRFAIMGRMDVRDASNEPALEHWRDQPGMLGIRVTFARGAAKDWLTDGGSDWFFAAAERAGVPLMIFAPYLTAELRSLAERHPGLRLTIDHLGIFADLRDQEIVSVIDDTLTLASLDNVAVKATSLPCLVTEPYPWPLLREQLSRVYDAFGPERLFFGSDLSRLPCPYRQLVTFFTEELDFLSGEELESVMGAGIERWLGWDTGR